VRLSPRIRELWDNLVNSLTTDKPGFSSRKLTAFVVIFCVIAIHFVWLKRAMMTDNFMYLESILIADYAFVSALLGMTTYQTIKKKENPPSASDEAK
jgi:hypothetical protein